LHFDRLRFAVLGNVGQGLLDDSEDCHFHRRRQLNHLRAFKRRGDSILGRELLNQPAYRCHQAPFGQHRRMQAVHQGADVPNRREQRCPDIPDLARRLCAIGRQANQVDV
jgi:hypothetical protein